MTMTYDPTRAPGYEDIWGLDLQPGVPEDRIAEAIKLARFARGVFLLTGPPGQGKSLVGVAISKLLSRYFGRTPVLDFVPKPAFGEEGKDWIYFDPVETIKGEVAFREAMTRRNKDDRKQGFADAAKMWLADDGKTSIFRKATIVLQEGGRYFNRRRPMSDIVEFLGQLLVEWRHHDCAYIIDAQFPNWLDVQRCLQAVTYWGSCSWGTTFPYTVDVSVVSVQEVTNDGVLRYGHSAPEIIHIFGPDWYDHYWTQSPIGATPRIRLKKMEDDAHKAGEIDEVIND